VSALLVGQGNAFAGVAKDGLIREFARSDIGQQGVSGGVDSRHIDLILGLAAGVDLTPEAVAKLVGRHFEPYSIEKALEIPDFLQNVSALGLGEDTEDAVRAALLELADRNPGMTPTLVEQALLSESHSVRVSQLIDPQCEDPNLPEAMRLSLDCPPVETSAVTPLGTITNPNLNTGPQFGGPQFGSVDGYGG